MFLEQLIQLFSSPDIELMSDLELNSWCSVIIKPVLQLDFMFFKDIFLCIYSLLALMQIL